MAEILRGGSRSGAAQTRETMKKGVHAMLKKISERQLCLRTGESNITLLPDRQILLEGSRISRLAADSPRLRVPVIEAN